MPIATGYGGLSQGIVQGLGIAGDVIDRRQRRDELNLEAAKLKKAEERKALRDKRSDALANFNAAGKFMMQKLPASANKAKSDFYNGPYKESFKVLTGYDLPEVLPEEWNPSIEKAVKDLNLFTEKRNKREITQEQYEQSIASLYDRYRNDPGLMDIIKRKEEREKEERDSKIESYAQVQANFLMTPKDQRDENNDSQIMEIVRFGLADSDAGARIATRSSEIVAKEKMKVQQQMGKKLSKKDIIAMATKISSSLFIPLDEAVEQVVKVQESLDIPLVDEESNKPVKDKEENTGENISNGNDPLGMFQ